VRGKWTGRAGGGTLTGTTQRVLTKARTDGRTTEPELTILTRSQRDRVTETCDHVRLTTELLPGLQNGKRKGGCLGC